MPIFLGSTEPTAIYHGSTEIAEVYKGSTKIWPIDDTLSVGLIGHWKFDETSGTIAADSSVNGNDGTLFNMDDSDWISGKIGNALDFDGSGNQYVRLLGVPDLLDGLTEVTVCAWLKYNPASVESDGTIISSYSPGVGVLFWVDNVGGGSGNQNTVSFNVSDSSGSNQVEGSTDLVITGQWDHYCGAYSSAAPFLRLYKNGVLDQEKTTGYFAPTIVGNGEDIQFGASLYGQRLLNGALDDIRIYSRVLSDEEISAIYELGGPVLLAASTVWDGGGTLWDVDVRTAKASTEWDKRR